MYSNDENLIKKNKSISPKKVTFNNSISSQTIKTEPNKKIPHTIKKNREILQNLNQYQNQNQNQLIIPYLKKINKTPRKKNTKKVFLTPKEKIQKKFNKLYGLNKEFLKNIKAVKKEKYLDLQDYQEQLLNASNNLSRENVLKLYTKLKSLKNQTNTIHPLPPVNFNAIYEHSYRETLKTRSKDKRSLKYVLNNKRELDDFEIEQANINKGKYLKIQRENPAMYKIYEILPEYVIDALYKKNKI